MKALSVKQPWAWLIAQGIKDIENRTWRTKFRGRFLIHASKKLDKEAYKRLQEIVQLPEVSELKFGGLIGEVELHDCVEKSESPWFEGPFGFVLKNAKQIEFVEMKGKLGFFNVV